MYRKLAFPLAAFAIAGCPTRDISKVDPSAAIEYRQNVSVNHERNVDILFVIDNSHSMKEEQASLSRNFINFVNVLNTIEGGLPNLHIGVVSSDLGIGGWTSDQCDGDGDNGLLQNTPRCLPSDPTDDKCPANCTPTCQPPRDRFISDIALPGGGRDKNYTGSLAEAFSCIALLYKCGCGVEQHLESMKRALDGTRLENQGFLRKDAYLAVIILADEDDCSSAKPEIIFNPSASLDTLNSEFGPFNSYRCTEFGIMCDGMTLSRSAAEYRNCVPRVYSPASDALINDPIPYFNFLRSLKGNPSLLIGAVIAGNPAPVGVGLTERGAPNLKPSCSSAGNGIADPAVRLKAFVDQFGSQGKFISICQDDLSDAVTTVANLLKVVLGSTCLQGNIDTTDIDSTMPGVQLDCHLSDVRFQGEVGETEKSIPRCRMTGPTTPDTTGTSADKPCWWATVNASKCSGSQNPTQFELKIERNGQDAPVGTEVVARCMVTE